MFEGICVFLRLCHLGFIHQLSKKSHRLASTSTSVFMILFIFFFKTPNWNILVLRLLNSRTRMTLKSSIVILQALETTAPQWPLQPHWRQQSLQPYFLKKLPDPNGLIIKMTSIGHFFGMVLQKSKLSPMYGTVSVGGCWGQPILLKTGGWNSNVMSSEIHSYLQTISKLHISICQRQFKRNISIWDTMY